MPITDGLHGFKVSRIPHSQQLFDFRHNPFIYHDVYAFVDSIIKDFSIHIQSDL